MRERKDERRTTVGKPEKRQKGKSKSSEARIGSEVFFSFPGTTRFLEGTLEGGVRETRVRGGVFRLREVHRC